MYRLTVHNIGVQCYENGFRILEIHSSMPTAGLMFILLEFRMPKPQTFHKLHAFLLGFRFFNVDFNLGGLVSLNRLGDVGMG